MSIFGDYVAVVKLTLNDEYYQMLKEMADAENKSIQDYIRDKIFNLSTIFTPEEAIKRIQNCNFESSEGFTLPDVYGDDSADQQLCFEKNL